MDVMSLLQSVAGVPQSVLHRADWDDAAVREDPTAHRSEVGMPMPIKPSRYDCKADPERISRSEVSAESLKAKADISHKQALTKADRGAHPGKAKLLETQIKNPNSQINNRAQEMALKERKAGIPSGNTTTARRPLPKRSSGW